MQLPFQRIPEILPEALQNLCCAFKQANATKLAEALGVYVDHKGRVRKVLQTIKFQPHSLQDLHKNNGIHNVCTEFVLFPSGSSTVESNY